MRLALFLAIVGLGGAAVLISLGIWQMQRLAWKQGVIADIEARIDAEPVALPAELNPERDNYLPVTVTGLLGRKYIRVLVSQKTRGAGYRVIHSMRMEDKRVIMVDIGFAPADAGFWRSDERRIHGLKTVVGNLQWPQESDGFTPVPDLANNIWYARDVPEMAKMLQADPILVVMREPVQGVSGKLMTPMPVDTARIPNNHLQYAITWFSLAAIWLAMSLYFVRRSTPEPKG